jgi:N utilization substance protein A
MLTFDTQTIRLIVLFESMTGTSVRDCVIDPERRMAYFVVVRGDIGRAIGLRGGRIKKFERATKLSARAIEFTQDVSEFVRRLIPQAVSVHIGESGTDVEVRVAKEDRGQVLGRNRRNLKLYQRLLKRNHGVTRLIIR